MFGFRGKILRVNLSSGKFLVEKLKEDSLMKFLGGRGIGARILFNELKPKINPLGPENKLIFATGPLTGAPFSGNARYGVYGKSPLTGLWADSYAGGFFGPELKFCGFDAVILEGVSSKPVYLLIYKETIELKNAKHLWGNTTGETQRIIRSELKDNKVRVASIGIGGENLVKYACIISDLHNAAGRCGMGAVMGSKNLKAVALRGTKKVEIADIEKFKKLAKIASEEVWKHGKILTKHGTNGDLEVLNQSGELPTKNFLRNKFKGAKKITGETMTDTILVGRAGCFACRNACHRVVKSDKSYIVNSAYGGPEYETAAAFGSLLLNDNLESIAKANELCNKYGLDTISTGVSIAFAFECFENGLITKKDTEGLDLSWGQPNIIIQLVDKIAKREGIGDLLAEGVKLAAMKIGGEAKKYAMHIKGLEIPMHEPRTLKGQALSYVTSNRGACHLQYVPEFSFSYEFEEALNSNLDFNRTNVTDRLFSGPKKAEMVALGENWMSAMESLITCVFTTQPEHGLSMNTLLNLFSAVTGWSYSPSQFMEVGERIWNLCRAFNIREGITRKDDIIPDRLSEPIKEGPFKGEFFAKQTLEKLLDAYYTFRGWDVKTGVPTRKKLRELGIEYVTDLL